ncbi:hypothetical protein ILUMI_00988 [Ignelater luminosus]|uniref:BED-type domain-containing protein n=1 Tax=Ignelater luminosus TaxID=2038154 RepID=A0A8K0DKX1_IGNLU|nr:hypothetical protein ILUMI_00988 [Ignelater luminosus]
MADRDLSESNVWKYFKKCSGQGLARCTKCPKTMSCKGSSTSDLSRHLEAIHGIRPFKRTASASVANNVEETDENVKKSRLAVEDNISIRVIANSDFIRQALSDKGKCDSTEINNIVQKQLQEFGIDFKTEIVACPTDGASVMRKFGRESPVQNLLKERFQGQSPNEEENEHQESNEDEFDDETEPQDLVILTLRSNIQNAIDEVRNIISPTKNIVLQEYVQKEFHKELNLLLDVRTRKAQIDLHLIEKWNDANIPILESIIQVLTPIKVAVKALSRGDATLLSAEIVINFLMKKIKALDTSLANEIYEALLRRKQLMDRLFNSKFTTLEASTSQEREEEIENKNSSDMTLKDELDKGVGKYLLKSPPRPSQARTCLNIRQLSVRDRVQARWSTKGLHVHLKTKHHIENLSKKVLENAASSSSASTSSSSRMLSAEPPSITTAKRMKITEHFPIQNNENSMEERVARMATKAGLPLSVFVTSSDLRDLFKAKGQIDVPLENPEAETNSDGDRSNITDDDRFIVEVSSSSEIEQELISDFNDIINKGRKIVRLFKGSPTKNDTLQKYVKKEFGRKIDAKTLIDLGLSTNIEYRFSEHEFCALENLENILKPVRLAVKVLCRQDANLIIAEATFKFMIKKLEDNHSALASELALSLRRRISQRRTNLTALLIYLQKPCSYHASCDDEIFHLPAKNLLRKEIKKAVQVTNNNEEVSPSDLTLQQELELTISSASNVICPAPSRANTLESIIEKEMTL